MTEVTTDFAISYLLDDCDDCPENKDGECMTQSHCFEVKYRAIRALRVSDFIYSDLLRVKHGTLNIDALIDKVYSELKGVKNESDNHS